MQAVLQQQISFRGYSIIIITSYITDMNAASGNTAGRYTTQMTVVFAPN
ncbi:hypothetical protein [Arachidicoccus sp.]